MSDGAEKGPLQRAKGCVDWQPVQDTQKNNREFTDLTKIYRKGRAVSKT